MALFLVGICFVAGGSPQTSPSPGVDCTSLVMNMADCLSYVTNGSTETKPEDTCCSGLKTVLKADVDCLCEAFKSSAQFGVVLNITKAVALPTACHVSAPSVSNCGRQSSPLFFFSFFFLLLGKFRPVWLLGKLFLLEFQQEIFFVVIDGPFDFS